MKKLSPDRVVDTILDRHMCPVFIDYPEVVRRRLKHPYNDTWEKVVDGETGRIVTITEYLYEEKYQDVIKMVQDLLRKMDLPAFRRDPEKLRVYVEGAARRIIERALKD